MKFCPECGAPLEPDDTFCINCGVSLEDIPETGLPASGASAAPGRFAAAGGSAVTDAATASGISSPASDTTPVPRRTRKKKFNFVPLIIIAAVLVIAGIAFLIVRSTPAFTLLRAAKSTYQELEHFETVKELQILGKGGSLEASANLSEFLKGLPYLDAVDAQAKAELSYRPEEGAFICQGSAAVGGFSALDATVWITPETAFLRSSALLGKDAYKVDLRDFYEASCSKTLSGITERLGDQPEDKLKALVTDAFRYGEVSKENVTDTQAVQEEWISPEDATLIYLTLDRKSAEKALEKALDFKAELPADFILRLVFSIDKNQKLSAITYKKDYAAYTLRLTDCTEDSFALTFRCDSPVYTGECTCNVREDTEEKLQAALAVKLNETQTANVEVAWNRGSGKFEAKVNKTLITPEMTLRLREEPNLPNVPTTGKDFCLTEEEDLMELAGVLDTNAGDLISKLGYNLPFSLQDTIYAYLTDFSDSYIAPITGAGMITMSEKEFEATLQSVSQSVAESVAAEVAAEVAADTAAQVASDTAQSVAAEAAAAAIQEELAKHPLSGDNSTTTGTGGSNPGSAGSSAGSASSSAAKNDMYSKVAGTYIYADGASYGVDASAKFDDKGNYSFSVKSLFFNIADKGTYKIDNNGNLSFTTNTSYKATGKYANGKIQLTVAGVATVELIKQ